MPTHMKRIDKKRILFYKYIMTNQIKNKRMYFEHSLFLHKKRPIGKVVVLIGFNIHATIITMSAYFVVSYYALTPPLTYYETFG